MKRLRVSGLDVFLVLLAGVEVATVLAASGPHRPAAAALSALSALVFLGRRWQPLAASITAFAATTLSVVLMPHSTIAQFFGILTSFALAGAVNREREAAVAWLAGVGALGYASWGDPLGGGAGDFLLSLAFTTTLWAGGLLLARRTRSTAAAELRAELAERDRQDQARHAVEEERARIARELHDIVSHGLSVVVLQTVAARAALTDGGTDVDRHLDAVEETARDALGEMRRMLGLLQAGDLPDPAALPAPSPGLHSLPALVDRAGAAGLRITADLDLEADLPSGLELAIYRVVQEALTNAVKHAPGSAVTVRLRIDDAGAVVTVTDDGARAPASRPDGAGQGLIGMRQRAELYGGSLSTGPADDGGYRVTATFPLEQAAVREAPAPSR
jgi:signal transduction histidine kinase